MSSLPESHHGTDWPSSCGICRSPAKEPTAVWESPSCLGSAEDQKLPLKGSALQCLAPRLPPALPSGPCRGIKGQRGVRRPRPCPVGGELLFSKGSSCGSGELDRCWDGQWWLTCSSEPTSGLCLFSRQPKVPPGTPALHAPGKGDRTLFVPLSRSDRSLLPGTRWELGVMMTWGLSPL